MLAPFSNFIWERYVGIHNDDSGEFWATPANSTRYSIIQPFGQVFLNAHDRQCFVINR